MLEVEVAVIGAGVIGLAIAREVSVRGHETLVLEAGLSPGQGISSRNSEVVHAGLYYPEGSLKALHCIRGRRLLYEYCEEKSVPFRKTGKLIVATESAEDAKLEQIALSAVANGVGGCGRAFTPDRARSLCLRARSGLYVSTFFSCHRDC